MWDVIWWILIVPYVLSCIGLIVIVLLQKGKGVGFAGAFGVGAGSETVFGPRASKSLPQKLTYIMAGIFMTLALVMSIIVGRIGKGSAPEKLSEDASAITAPADQALTPGTLDDLGSALTDNAPVAPSTSVTVTPAEAPAAPVEAPAAPAEEAPAAPVEAPVSPAEAPAAPSEAPAAPATN